jgi:hypothetical protein
MSRASRTSERGMALALAIFALVVVGALVATAFVAGHLEQRTGRSTLYAAQAADAAEAGAAQTLAEWDVLGLNSVGVGASVTMPRVTIGGRSAYTPTVSRLNDQLFLIRSLGTRTDANGGTLARRTVGMVARLASLGTGPEAALTVVAPVVTSSAASIHGSDLPVGGATLAGCAPGPDRPAIRTVDASSTALAVLGDVSFDKLRKHASIVLPDTSLASALHPILEQSSRSCDGTDRSNWGEPRRGGTGLEACSRYFPIIYARGPRLGIAAGGRGQGILLVDGDLDVSAPFEFSGLIVVRGRLALSGGQTRITGAIIAAGIERPHAVDEATIQYSSCALRSALSGAAFAEPLGQRSWLQVY